MRIMTVATDVLTSLVTELNENGLSFRFYLKKVYVLIALFAKLCSLFVCLLDEPQRKYKVECKNKFLYCIQEHDVYISRIFYRHYKFY